MNASLSAKTLSVGLAALICIAQTPIASAATPLPELKPTGISLDLYRHAQDYDVTNIDAALPGMTAAEVQAMKSQLDVANTIDVYGLRLGYQLNLSFNIFGSLGKAEQTTSASFSAVNPLLTDVEVDAEGVVYSVGTSYLKHLEPVFLSLTALHSRLDLDDNPHDIKATSIIPSVGVMTPIGVLTGSLLFQEVDMRFTGDVEIPGMGSIPVDIAAENVQDMQVLAGLRTRLAKDLFLNTNVNLDKDEFYQIQINQRF